MKRLILAVALAAGFTFASSAPALAAAKNYDCSKPGNANKAVCKEAAKQAPKAATKSAPTKAPAAKPAESKASSTSTTKTKTATTPKPAPAAMNKTAAPAAAPPKGAAATTKSADNNNPAGATAQCKDGTYSHAKGHSGACSRHGGVAKWL